MRWSFLAFGYTVNSRHLEHAGTVNPFLTPGCRNQCRPHNYCLQFKRLCLRQKSQPSCNITTATEWHFVARKNCSSNQQEPGTVPIQSNHPVYMYLQIWIDKSTHEYANNDIDHTNKPGQEKRGCPQYPDEFLLSCKSVSLNVRWPSSGSDHD